MDEKSRRSTANTINILMLGETGVGKSTWVNSFVNFIQHESLQDAETGQLHNLIPTKFTVTNDNLEQVVVCTGTHQNEVQVAGEATTQSATVYSIKFGAKDINLIDTPGFGRRCYDQDKKNLQNILSTIANLDELHGICIFLKPNNDRLILMFVFCIMELLTYLNTDARRNIVFCFTYNRGTFYKPGDTRTALEGLLSSQDVKIPVPLGDETIYCLDNEAYRFLAAVKNEPPVRFSPEDKADFSRCWDNSKAETWRMLEWIATLKPHPIQSPRNLNYVLELVQKLTRPLAEISRNIQTNKAILEDEMRDIQKTSATIENLTRKKMTTRIVIVMEPLPYPNTVCCNPNCCKISSFEEHQTKEYTTICHQNCQLRNHVKWDTIGDPALMNCRAVVSRNVCNCGHRYQEHLHIYYKSKQVAKKVEDEVVKEGLQKNLSDVQLKQKMLEARRNEIKEYENDLEEIQRASVIFAFFLKANAITPYNDEIDKFLGHLIKEEREKVAEGGSDKTLKSLEQSRAEYGKQKKEFETLVKDGKGTEHTKKFSHDEVEALVTRLKDLKHAGASLKEALKCVEETGHAVFQESIVTFEPEQQQQQVHVNKTNEKKSLFQTVSNWVSTTKQKESDKMTSGNVSRKQWEAARSQSLRPGPGPTLGSNANIASSSTLSVEPSSSAATASSSTKTEACRFWPYCSKKEGCPYEHPLCRIPFCDGNDCPYWHSSNSSHIESTESQRSKSTEHENASGIHRTGAVEERPPESRKPCRYDPNCTKTDCPFDHGDCRYGNDCKNKSCGYTHP